MSFVEEKTSLFTNEAHKLKSINHEKDCLPTALLIVN